MAGIVLGVALLLLIVLTRRRNQERALQAWRHETEGALDAAHSARSLLPPSGQDISDLAHWQSVRDGVGQAAESLEQAGARAPTPEAAASTRATAEALRGLAFAIEADRLLHGAPTPPTAEQLAEADTATRARAAELETALATLEGIVRPAPGNGTATSSASG